MRTKHTIRINLSPLWVWFLLWVHQSCDPRMIIMCRGYSEDYEDFAELVWEDDKNLDFADRESYPQFQLWLI